MAALLSLTRMADVALVLSRLTPRTTARLLHVLLRADADKARAASLASLSLPLSRSHSHRAEPYHPSALPLH